MKNLDYPICEEVVYSSTGKDCKMCRMSVKANKEFYSRKCKIKCFLINKIGTIKNE